MRDKTPVGVVLASCISQFDPVSLQIQMGSCYVDVIFFLLCLCEPNRQKKKGSVLLHLVFLDIKERIKYMPVGCVCLC